MGKPWERDWLAHCLLSRNVCPPENEAVRVKSGFALSRHYTGGEVKILRYDRALYVFVRYLNDTFIKTFFIVKTTIKANDTLEHVVSVSAIILVI